MINGQKSGRRRRSSSLLYSEPPESLEHISDQSALPNLNAQWVNGKGAWIIHFILTGVARLLFGVIPGVSQELAWTFTVLTYCATTYLMFHYVRGVPFELNAGAYDHLNMWEQIDRGDQYTPTKKFLLAAPVFLFLASTHFTHYGITHFAVNLIAVAAMVIVKLPASHRLRVRFFNNPPDDRDDR